MIEDRTLRAAKEKKKEDFSPNKTGGQWYEPLSKGNKGQNAWNSDATTWSLFLPPPLSAKEKAM